MKLDLNHFLRQSEGRIFNVKFIKKDGSLRSMNARLGVKKYLKGTGMRYNALSRGLLPVFDMTKQSYRMINLNTVQSITLDGKEYIHA